MSLLGSRDQPESTTATAALIEGTARGGFGAEGARVLAGSGGVQGGQSRRASDVHEDHRGWRHGREYQWRGRQQVTRVGRVAKHGTRPRVGTCAGSNPSTGTTYSIETSAMTLAAPERAWLRLRSVCRQGGQSPSCERRRGGSASRDRTAEAHPPKRLSSLVASSDVGRRAVPRPRYASSPLPQGLRPSQAGDREGRRRPSLPAT
jgi:hypothetical protein